MNINRETRGHPNERDATRGRGMDSYSFGRRVRRVLGTSTVLVRRGLHSFLWRDSAVIPPITCGWCGYRYACEFNTESELRHLSVCIVYQTEPAVEIRDGKEFIE